MEIKNNQQKEIISETAYLGPDATLYDSKRFIDPWGKLFNKMEMRQLECILKTLPPQQTLEVGCGTGRFLVKCLEAGHEVYGLDPSPQMLEECAKKISNFKLAHLQLGEGIKLPFENNQFNFVYSIRVLNQVSSETYALEMIREMIRVCADNGIILLEFVNKQSPLALRRFQTVRLSIADIKSLLKEFKNVKIKNISGILFFPETLMRMAPSFLLGIFEKIDAFFSKIFPQLTSRCYIILKKVKF